MNELMRLEQWLVQSTGSINISDDFCLLLLPLFLYWIHLIYSHHLYNLILSKQLFLIQVFSLIHHVTKGNVIDASEFLSHLSTDYNYRIMG